MSINSEYFAPEIALIVNPALRSFTTRYVDLFPDYFHVKPASSTGKYHPSWANSVGGLRKHTKVVAYMTHALADAYGLTEIERDAAIVAALGHDGCKYGIVGGKFTTGSHAAEGAMFYKRVAKMLNASDMPMGQEIYLAIADHMGSFLGDGAERKFPEEFPKISQLVHIADMCASRKEINFTFLEEGALIG